MRIGYDLFSRIALLAAAAEIVLTHQEHYDGSAYLQGLVGEEIPLGGRIFAVADTLDAITSDRPYRRAAPFQVARAEVVRGSGRQFDPEVVRVFLAIPGEVWNNIFFDVAGPRPNVRPLAAALGLLALGGLLAASWRNHSARTLKEQEEHLRGVLESGRMP